VKKTSSNKIGYHLPVECICYFNKLIEQRDVLVRKLELCACATEALSR